MYLLLLAASAKAVRFCRGTDFAVATTASTHSVGTDPWTPLPRMTTSLQDGITLHQFPMNVCCLWETTIATDNILCDL